MTLLPTRSIVKDRATIERRRNRILMCDQRFKILSRFKLFLYVLNEAIQTAKAIQLLLIALLLQNLTNSAEN
jgi:hypothetical protein